MLFFAFLLSIFLCTVPLFNSFGIGGYLPLNHFNFADRVKAPSRCLPAKARSVNLASRQHTHFCQASSCSDETTTPIISGKMNRSETLRGGIQVIQLSDELKTSFMAYAMSTILSRALPDARDGMKPVHRRVLYAMLSLNLLPESGYRKCARIVGETLGKFHPHGDQSVYDALVRMAQDFSMLHPLISGHGNYGSIDGDPPAAMRYTEAKLSSIAMHALLSDMKEDTVVFIPNFDGNEEEPVVLPARLPMMLLNGASGIAVGMATNIPPHNLHELGAGMIALIDDPNLSDEVLQYMLPNCYII